VSETSRESNVLKRDACEYLQLMVMDSHLIHKTSEKLKFKINWIKPSETEWIYCGAAGEVKWDVVAEELYSFLDDDTFHVATTRTKSFTINTKELLSSIENLVGHKSFFIWNEGFKKLVEFSQIGVFRKGVFNIDTDNNSFRKYPRSIAPGSPDKVRGKFVKYRKGDCLSIAFSDGIWLAVFISEKFNKYYDVTLIEYLNDRQPTMEDFHNGRFFGRFLKTGGEEYSPAVEKLVFECLDIDANPNIKKVGSLELIESIEKASYGYRKDIAELLQHYKEDVSWRIQNSINYEKKSEEFFTSDRLIEIKTILKALNH
jgi:hypothetical protein